MWAHSAQREYQRDRPKHLQQPLAFKGPNFGELLLNLLLRIFGLPAKHTRPDTSSFNGPNLAEGDDSTGSQNRPISIQVLCNYRIPRKMFKAIGLKAPPHFLKVTLKNTIQAVS